VPRPGGACQIPPHARVDLLEGLDIPISSSNIREHLARGEATPELPKAVRRYIDKHRLYGPRAQS
jgi:nicotinic acid mononucleotide adenylyltransferase